ncbi:MAG: hypothetical protein IJW86_08095 [Clostridia bacterium]|nr:hypothetical protein [Clostridia bacterium]
MKKFLALILAVIMTFSVATVAFAAEETAAPEETTAVLESDEEAGALDWLLDLPVWTLGPASKIAKIALKLVKVIVKIAMALGVIDTDEIIHQIAEMIANSDSSAEEETTAPDAATAPAAA